MISIVGVFKDAAAARVVCDKLEQIGIRDEQRILLMPGASENELAHVPVTTAEQPGMGKVMGGIVGGAMGLGAAAGIAAIPGVGPVTIVGILGLALLGIGGTAAGVKVGDMMDDKLDEGLPVDELFVYEDALRKGRSVVIALADDDELADRARTIMANSAAETVDAARDEWWVGLRSAEKAAYHGDEISDAKDSERLDWDQEESIYRAGFEAALLPTTRGRHFDEVKELLRERHPDLYRSDTFRRGYERGQEHDRSVRSLKRTTIL